MLDAADLDWMLVLLDIHRHRVEVVNFETLVRNGVLMLVLDLMVVVCLRSLSFAQMDSGVTDAVLVVLELCGDWRVMFGLLLLNGLVLVLVMLTAMLRRCGPVIIELMVLRLVFVELPMLVAMLDLC